MSGGAWCARGLYDKLVGLEFDRAMDGLLIVDKPVGPTSHDVVARARRALGERRIGHTGTLDPMASGVLPLVLGRATRLARFLSATEKSYIAVVRLGMDTDSHDADGKPVGDPYRGAMPAAAAIERAVAGFRGTFLQQPPMFSAKKIAGVRSHALARKQRVESALDAAQARAFDAAQARAFDAAQARPVSVTVSDLEMRGIEGTDVELALTCSAGFYVRALAHDLGQRLGTGAHLKALRRTRAGDLRVEDAIALDAIVGDPAAAVKAVVPMGRMLTTLPAAALSDEGVRRARHGRSLGPQDFCAPLPQAAPGFTRLLDTSGDLVGIAEPIGADGLLHPVVILV
jgi:tRNA pseudouridine55 synthase